MVNRKSLKETSIVTDKSDIEQNGVLVYENNLFCNTTKNCFRILIFQDASEVLSVDFVTQEIIMDSFVVIAPKQFLFMSKTIVSSFICFEIATNELQQEDLLLFYSLMFQKQKLLFPTAKSTMGYKLLKDLLASNYSNLKIYGLLKSEMRERSICQFGETVKINSHQFQIANHFLQTLNRFIEFNIEHTYISNYINDKIHNDRALLRMCKDVFKVSTRELLKYQLLLKTIQLLGNRKKSTISIANTLGYSSISALNKFVKKQTDKTPKDIRNQILLVTKV